MSEVDLRKRARRRALRAAQVVTVGLAMAGSGCSESHSPTSDDDPPIARDGGPIRVDADTPPLDQGLADLGRDAGPTTMDAGSCPVDPWVEPPTTRECCDEIGGWWEDATDECLVAVPGPFVPPSMSA